MKTVFISGASPKLLIIVVVGLLVAGCQTYPYPRNSIEVESLTKYTSSDRVFSSPAYPVGNIKDGVNVSFYAKVLEAGGVNYTMWIAFPRKLSLRSVQVAGKELDWKLAPSDNRIRLIEIPSVSITSTFELDFENSTKQFNIPDWWIEGYSRKIEGIHRKAYTNNQKDIDKNAYGSKKLYRSPSAGDKGSYYVLMRESVGHRVYRVITSRI